MTSLTKAYNSPSRQCSIRVLFCTETIFKLIRRRHETACTSRGNDVGESTRESDVGMSHAYMCEVESGLEWEFLFPSSSWECCGNGHGHL